MHPTPDTRHPKPRAAFTLVELLITILIIGILAAAVLGVAAVAGQTAREARTRNMIARIHTLLTEHYDTYKSRRVKVRKEVLDAIDQQTTLSSAARNRFKARARLYAHREMMLMEIPQQWSDMLLNRVPSTPSSFSQSSLKYPWYLELPSGPYGRTELTTVYLRHFDRICHANNKLTNSPNTDEQIRDNEGAECLYLIVVNACGDGEARSQFQESSIGDVDGDGAPEFLDGWGHPISFLRWAPGFNSEIQANANVLIKFGDPPVIVDDNPQWEEVSARDHDPFDIQRVDLAAFRLVPLVFSAGQDEQFGIAQPDDNLVLDYYTWDGITNVDSQFTGFTPANSLSPYVRQSGTEYPGTVIDSTVAVDNVHNHVISMRPKR